MKRVDDAAYDSLVYDQARDIAARCGQDTLMMANQLISLCANRAAIAKVTKAQQAPDYEPIMYRGKMCDEAVIEAIKEVLRPLYGF